MLLCSTEILLGCTDTEKNIDCLMLICCGTLGVTKTILFRIYAKNLTENYSSAVNDYKTIKNPRDYSIMRRHTYTGKLLFSCLLGSSYFSCFILTVLPLLGHNADQDVTNETVLEYIIPSTCALEYFCVPTSLRAIVLLVQTLVLFTTCNTYMGNTVFFLPFVSLADQFIYSHDCFRVQLFFHVLSRVLLSLYNNNVFLVFICDFFLYKGNDTLFLSIVLHLCGQIKILNRKYVDLDITSPHDQLTALIKRHIYLIHKANKLSETISIALLMQLFLLSIILCIMGK